MFEKDLSKTHRMIFESIKKFFNISLLVPVFIFTLDRISKIYVINLSKNSFDIELFSSKFLNITLIWKIQKQKFKPPRLKVQSVKYAGKLLRKHVQEKLVQNTQNDF